jgi:NAD(P)-dependent dehydrogenase (short-subunit alcohol dehydrogenase family)
MDTGLKNRTVVIAGAGRNMGRLVALAFAREGANLAICNRANAAELQEVADAARALGVAVVAAQCDVTDASACANFITQAHNGFGRIDAVIYCASYRCERPFLEETPAAWNENLAVNLTGPCNVCRSALPFMIERRWGRIITIAGISPFLGLGVAKSAAKMGVIGFTRGLATEFGPYNITANCVSPGRIPREVEHRGERPLPARQALARKGTAADIVSLIVYLSSEGAGFITGQCYHANGGVYYQ